MTKNHISTNQNSLYSQFPQSRNRNSIGRNSNSTNLLTTLTSLKPHFNWSEFTQFPLISRGHVFRVYCTYNVTILQWFYVTIVRAVTRRDVAREQNRFTVVSLGIYTRVAILFSHRPANAKRRTPPRRTRIYARRLFQYFRYHPPFPSNDLSTFRAIRYFLFNFSSFFFIITFCYNNKIVINIYFFYSYAFFHVHSKSYTCRVIFTWYWI